MQYAIHEIYPLIRSLGNNFSDQSPIARYVCALLSELAYYSIPQWEVDNKKRAKLIPSEAYRSLIASIATRTNLRATFQLLDLPKGFVVEDRGVIAIGIKIDNLLFIAFRGTQFLFDWRLNLNARQINVTSRMRIRPPQVLTTLGGKLHSGFAEEALRISVRLLDAIREEGVDDFEHMFLTGHSLGGAVAAISENFLRLGSTSVVTFGAPRYADVASYFSSQWGPSTQIRRPFDIVPTVPPKFLGYADHPYEFSTSGENYVDFRPPPFSSIELWRWVQFLTRRIEPHSIESYRKEVGKTANATGAELPLAPIEKLTEADVH
jgi:Lipase (class 3)